MPWTLALENLRDSDGNEISPEAHATCPGRVVTITYEWVWAPGAEAAYRAAHGLAEDDDVEFGNDDQAAEADWALCWQIGPHLCTDPDKYGHANVHGPARETPTPEQQTAEDEDAEAATKTEERRRVRWRNTQWRAATEVRTAHLKALLARKVPPPGTLRLIVEAMARGETQPLMSPSATRPPASYSASPTAARSPGTGTSWIRPRPNRSGTTRTQRLPGPG